MFFSFDHSSIPQTVMMKRSLIVLLVLCAFVAAMVPRDKRALNTEDEELLQPQSTTTNSIPKECAKQTPCAWSIYRPANKYIELNITNSYCVCSEGEECTVTEDDSSINAFIHRCRKMAES